MAATVEDVEPTESERGGDGGGDAAEPRGVDEPGDDVCDDDVQAPNAAAAIRPEPARRNVRRLKSLWGMCIRQVEPDRPVNRWGRDSRRVAPSGTLAPERRDRSSR
jgi:hypothetical protein